MTISSSEPHRSRAKIIAALLAATAALAGGAQALSPAPAAAVMQENEECSDSASIYLLDCQEENGGGGGGGGTGSADGAVDAGAVEPATEAVDAGTATDAGTASEPDPQTASTVQPFHGDDYWKAHQRWLDQRYSQCVRIAKQFDRADHPRTGVIYRLLVRLFPSSSDELTPRQRANLAAGWDVENCQEIYDMAGPTPWP